MIATSSAWPIVGNQYLDAVIFIVALIVITIICYYFIAIIIIISTMRTNFLPILN